MSGSDHGDSRPMDNSGEEVLAIHIHPKLMTNRNNASNPTSARQQTPRSARSDAAAPTNAELAEAGVSAQDGVVQQLSARRQESGSLAAPRDVSGNSSGRRGPPAITAGGRMGEPLQLSETRQRREGSAAAGQQPQQQQRPVRHAPYAGGTRASPGSSREPIRPGRSGRQAGNSPFRSPSKHNDPYGHVTSVVHEYRNNHLSALEAQYKSVRSHSNAPASQARDNAEHGSASRQQREAEHSAAAHEVHTPRSTRQDSPQPRPTDVEYLRGGVPRAALDAPHIKYAEALENMHNPRYSPRAGRPYTPSASTAPASAFLPQAAQYIPDRYKYVEASEEEKRLRKEETLRLLQDWRERQKARTSGVTHNRAPSSEPQPARSSSKASAPKRTVSRNRAHMRVQQAPAEKAAPAQAHAPATAAQDEEKPEWDSTFKPGFGTPPHSPRTGSRTPRSGRAGRKSTAASRASSRTGRKSRGATPPATARGEARGETRGEAPVNPNAFRRRLLFDITAPAVSAA